MQLNEEEGGTMKRRQRSAYLRMKEIEAMKMGKWKVDIVGFNKNDSVKIL